MDKALRTAQKKILDIFSRQKSTFALCGGTALELFYLSHRFSADLDFFTPRYDVKEVKQLVNIFGQEAGAKLKFESEFLSQGRAKVRFYYLPLKNYPRPLKIDFVEDVLFKEPKIRVFEGVRVYDLKNIYVQKLCAIAGAFEEVDEIGRKVTEGRHQARDAFDLYMISRKATALHIFLQAQPGFLQRGMIHWYRTFSRQELKLDLLDLDIYDKNFDAKEMIAYLEREIQKFIKEVIEE